VTVTHHVNKQSWRFCVGGEKTRKLVDASFWPASGQHWPALASLWPASGHPTNHKKPNNYISLSLFWPASFFFFSIKGLERIKVTKKQQKKADKEPTNREKAGQAGQSLKSLNKKLATNKKKLANAGHKKS